MDTTVAYVQDKLRLIHANITLDLNQFLRQGLGWILNNAGAVFSGITQLVFGFLLSMLAFYYFLKDGKKLVSALAVLSPLRDVDDREIFGKLNKAVHSVVLGSLVVAVIQGMLVSIGFYVFGVPNGALWGAIAAVTALIPFIGTAIIVIPAILYLFFTGSIPSGLGLLAWGATAVGLIDNFLTPKLMERGIQIHPLLILFSVLGGLSFFGPIGFLLGPLALSFLFALLDIYKKQLPSG
ncbi:AI-2E family transporter [Candidatus Azambacteria bacterium]|nr:AI-2E family transporter [Candidatus Azambacteria bacterium]